MFYGGQKASDDPIRMFPHNKVDVVSIREITSDDEEKSG